MPMMPIEPANAVRKVRPFLVMRLLNDSSSAVANDIDALPLAPSPRMVKFAVSPAACSTGSRPFSVVVASSSASSAGEKGMLSSVMRPSARRTVRVAYSAASSGLCVTMMTRRSFATSRRRSMICTPVLPSKAPVGSSASTMSGSLTSARAIATRCICPPDSWAGRLSACSARPTRASAAAARSRRSVASTPDSVSASSTLDSTLWWGMRL